MNVPSKAKLSSLTYHFPDHQRPRALVAADANRPLGKLRGKVALVTGGDSGIGRAVALAFAREGAEVALSYLPEAQDEAEVTRNAVHQYERRCLLLPGDLNDPEWCRQIVRRTITAMSRMDILVANTAAPRGPAILDQVNEETFERHLNADLMTYFRLARAAVPYMKRGSVILATSSTLHSGACASPEQIANHNGINAMTKALAQNLLRRGIRVNAIEPGAALIATARSNADGDVPRHAIFAGRGLHGRPAQPDELAPAYVFLASPEDSSHITGIVLPITGGEIIGTNAVTAIA